MERIRFATIGTSAIAEHFLEALAATPSAEHAAVYSRDGERARAFADAYGAPLAFSELSDLVACPEVDAVYIASPNACHAEQALAAIRAGKHVLVEKSFASNEREAASVFDAAREAGVVAMEAMRNVHGPGFASVADALPKLGQIRLASFGFSKVTSRYQRLLAGERLNLFDPHLSGGALLDIGVYVVEPAIMLFGAPDSVVSASVTREIEPACEGDEFTRIDLAGSAVLAYGDACVTLSWGKLSNDMCSSQLQGELGTIVWDETAYPRSATFFPHVDKGMVYGRGDAQGEDLGLDTVENDMVYELGDFCLALRGELDASRFEKITRTSLAVMDEIRAQAGVRFPADV